MSKINAGEVSLILNGQERILKPTLRAMMAVNRQFGGLAKARQAIVDENLDAIVAILRVGLNLSDKEARGLDEQVYQNGITADLLVPLIRYVGILGNGGKPLPDQAEDAGEGEAAAGNA